jgi:predicted nucleic acid-binding protein
VTRFVLDASVVLGWILDSPVPPYAARVRQQLVDGGRAAVPALWHLEVANGLVMAERRQMLTANEVDAAILLLEQLTTQALETEGDMVALRNAFDTARAYVLSTYDGVYLDLARRLRLPLATLDRALRAAAGKAGIELFR